MQCLVRPAHSPGAESPYVTPARWGGMATATADWKLSKMPVLPVPPWQEAARGEQRLQRDLRTSSFGSPITSPELSCNRETLSNVTLQRDLSVRSLTTYSLNQYLMSSYSAPALLTQQWIKPTRSPNICIFVSNGRHKGKWQFK